MICIALLLGFVSSGCGFLGSKCERGQDEYFDYDLLATRGTLKEGQTIIMGPHCRKWMVVYVDGGVANFVDLQSGATAEIQTRGFLHESVLYAFRVQNDEVILESTPFFNH